MHAVMQWAWAHGHIMANPLGIVDHILLEQNAKNEHRPAMPWRDIPAFTKAQLRDIEPWQEHARAAPAPDSHGVRVAAKCAARRGVMSTSMPKFGPFLTKG
jgi:hypothetical protein